MITRYLVIYYVYVVFIEQSVNAHIFGQHKTTNHQETNNSNESIKYSTISIVYVSLEFQCVRMMSDYKNYFCIYKFLYKFVITVQKPST